MKLLTNSCFFMVQKQLFHIWKRGGEEKTFSKKFGSRIVCCSFEKFQAFLQLRSKLSSFKLTVYMRSFEGFFSGGIFKVLLHNFEEGVSRAIRLWCAEKRLEIAQRSKLWSKRSEPESCACPLHRIHSFEEFRSSWVEFLGIINELSGQVKIFTFGSEVLSACGEGHEHAFTGEWFIWNRLNSSVGNLMFDSEVAFIGGFIVFDVASSFSFNNTRSRSPFFEG